MIRQRTVIAWRWTLIAAQVIVVAYFAALLSGGRKTRLNPGALLSVLIFIAWLFLFLGSPFLVRSQRWLAVLGWCIAVGALLFPML
jgi:hypothetical protein